MAAQAAVFLMYHEIEAPGAPPTSLDSGSLRYVVHRERFRDQVSWLQSQGMVGRSVAQWLAERTRPRQIVFTFDDGCRSDLTVAAPILAEAGFGATFYVTVNNVGRTGYLSLAELRELHALGFEIGAHSMTHAFLPELDDAALWRETHDARRWLEDAIGAPVPSFSCPGGRCDRRVMERVSAAGYGSLATSRIGVNRPGSSPIGLARVVITRSTTDAEFRHVAMGEGFVGARVRAAVLDLAKSLLGNQRYERVRERMLGGPA